ncbi:MAG TPA: nuclear transport factor 2 family protein [Thermoanaerobaculia bacterium]|nr:nuclear transport factor 2 family protein [Thermoanaerobaculia bacterium]
MKKLLVVLALFSTTALAQPLPKDDELYRTVAALDTQLFDAFNQCNLEKLGSLFDENVEFYHDQGGVSHGRRAVVEAVKNNICGKVQRVLVGTTQVYPMHGFGAVQMGVHRFTHPGRDDVEPMGEAQFIHLWQKQDGVWRITRVISYDHHAVTKK